MSDYIIEMIGKLSSRRADSGPRSHRGVSGRSGARIQISSSEVLSAHHYPLITLSTDFKAASQQSWAPEELWVMWVGEGGGKRAT